MKIDFVIPSYKNTSLLQQCLESLKKYHPVNNIIIVDDGSEESVQQKTKEIAEKYNAKVLLSKFNCGFSATVNRGLDSSDADIIVLTNSDIIFTQNIAGEVESRFTDDPKLGVMGFLLYMPDNRIQHGGIKRLKNGTNYSFGHYDHYSLTGKESMKSKYILGVTGALMCVRKEMINEIGVFNSKYFLAFEDVEMNLRAWHCGWKVYYSSNTTAIHLEGYTRGNTPQKKKELGTLEAEQKSLLQFQKDILRYDINKIEQIIDEANGVQTKKEYKKIGVKRTGALGDCIVATGIIEKLKNDNPASEIFVCTKQPFAFSNNHNIVKIFENNELMDCDIVYDLDLVYESRPDTKRWIAYADSVFGEGEYIEAEILPKLYSKQVDRIDLLNKIKSNKLFVGNNFVVIHPNANSWESRKLSKEVWDEVIDILILKGYKVISVGKNGDLKLREREMFFDMIDKFELGEIRELIKNAKMFIGLDSGIMHIALSTNTKVIGIFSVADPKNVIYRKHNSVAVEPESECKYCLTYKVKPPVTFLKCQQGNNECINSITSGKIIEAVEKLENN